MTCGDFVRADGEGLFPLDLSQLAQPLAKSSPSRGTSASQNSSNSVRTDSKGSPDTASGIANVLLDDQHVEHALGRRHCSHFGLCLKHSCSSLYEACLLQRGRSTQEHPKHGNLILTHQPHGLNAVADNAIYSGILDAEPPIKSFHHELRAVDGLQSSVPLRRQSIFRPDHLACPYVPESEGQGALVVQVNHHGATQDRQSDISPGL